MGSHRVILWALRGCHNASRCQAGPASFTSFVDNIAGPVVLAAAQDADARREALLGYGRCWQGLAAASGMRLRRGMVRSVLRDQCDGAS